MANSIVHVCACYSPGNSALLGIIHSPDRASEPPTHCALVNSATCALRDRMGYSYTYMLSFIWTRGTRSRPSPGAQRRADRWCKEGHASSPGLKTVVDTRSQAFICLNVMLCFFSTSRSWPLASLIPQRAYRSSVDKRGGACNADKSLQ